MYMIDILFFFLVKYLQSFGIDNRAIFLQKWSIIREGVTV